MKSERELLKRIVIQIVSDTMREMNHVFSSVDDLERAINRVIEENTQKMYDALREATIPTRSRRYDRTR